ncbi:MAG: hypothetical protein LBP26_02605 [Clostridiales bacterium]|jgi:hypothetical protein|nr:hypothetical protein [Clostridiales bacterium]
MIFSKSIMPLGDGAVISAKQRPDGVLEFLTSHEGAVVLKRLAPGGGVKSGGVISYADECFFAGEDSYFERRGNKLFFLNGR